MASQLFYWLIRYVSLICASLLQFSCLFLLFPHYMNLRVSFYIKKIMLAFKNQIVLSWYINLGRFDSVMKSAIECQAIISSVINKNDRRHYPSRLWTCSCESLVVVPSTPRPTWSLLLKYIPAPLASLLFFDSTGKFPRLRTPPLPPPCPTPQICIARPSPPLRIGSKVTISLSLHWPLYLKLLLPHLPAPNLPSPVLLCFPFHSPPSHIPVIDLIIMLIIYRLSPPLKCKPQEGRDFGLFYSLPYPKCLELCLVYSECSINICLTELKEVFI